MVKTATKRKDDTTASIKKRLSAALCMLLVSLIMLISSTYAWFTLATAPEAGNITTTITGNGSLEIALMPESGLFSDIKTGNSAELYNGSADITLANTSWGNVVDLSDLSYGLNDVTLYPSALNGTQYFASPLSKVDDNSYKASNNWTVSFAADFAESILKVPSYGRDGRIEDLINTLLLKWDGDADRFEKSSGYGVRAMGTISGGGDETVVTSEDGTSQTVIPPLEDVATFGYVIDLAFRTNASKIVSVPIDPSNPAKGNKDVEDSTQLYLQTEATQRIYSGANTNVSDSTNEETMGAGSNMTFDIKAMDMPYDRIEKLLGAIRITFVEGFGTSAGSSSANVTYALADFDRNTTYAADDETVITSDIVTAKLYPLTITNTYKGSYDDLTAQENGYKYISDVTDPELLASELKAVNSNTYITSLEKNVAKNVSAVVWLDGTNVTNSEVSSAVNLNGTLNLQFALDETLVPANNATLNPKN